MKKYCLEIYEPGSKLDVIHTFESDEQFLSISIGDTLSNAFFQGVEGPEKWLKVTNLNHILWENEEDGAVKHKVLVFTEEYKE